MQVGSHATIVTINDRSFTRHTTWRSVTIIDHQEPFVKLRGTPITHGRKRNRQSTVWVAKKSIAHNLFCHPDNKDSTNG